MKEGSVRPDNTVRPLLILQFFDSFNDHAFKIIVSLLVIREILYPRPIEFVSLIGLIFTVPFIIFSPLTGAWVDRFSRRKLIIWAKAFETAVMPFGALALANGSWILMCCAVFLIAAQSVLFSNAKYAVLADALSESEISRGNGFLQMFMFFGILSGTMFGIYVSYFWRDLPQVGIVLTSFSLISLLMAFKLPRISEEAQSEELRINSAQDIRRVFGDIARAKPLLAALSGLSFFWFVAAVFQINIIFYGDWAAFLYKRVYIGPPLFFMAVGIAFGGMVAARLSANRIELGLVPISAAGAAFLCFIISGIPSGPWLVVLLFFLLGACAGGFTVPLNSFFQKRSPVNRRGQYLAVLNVAIALAVLAGTGWMWVNSRLFFIGPAKMFIFMGLAFALASAYIVWRIPEALVRMCIWILVHTYYRLKIIDEKNIPDRGGALIVCNHVSFLDGLVISASLKRPVRFLMSRQFYNLPIVNFFSRIMRVIPIASGDGPKELAKALYEARKELRAGGLVCIFPEGQLTRTGNLLSFRGGFTHIVKGLKVPIIPMNLDEMWGDIFSWSDGKFIWKIPRQIPYPVTVSIGKPLPADISAHKLRIAVQELWAEAFRLRGLDRKKLHISFINEARRHPFRFCMADSLGTKLSYAQTLAAGLVVKRKLFPGNRMPRETNEMVGLLLPASCMAVIANAAVFFSGKVPVNLNFTLSKETLDSSIRQCGMRTIITSRKFLEKTGIEPRPEMAYLEDLKERTAASEKLGAFLVSLLLPAFLIRWWFVEGDKTNVDDTATVLFSSGSTGEPKGVMLTHANIASNIEAFYQLFNIKPDDVVMGALPFFHSFGFTAGMCFPAGAGIGVVYHSNPMDAQVIGRLVQRFKATLIMGTPTFLSAYLRRCGPEQFKTLRYAIAGAEKLKQQLSEEFYEKFHVTPFEGYGATELSPIVSVGFPDYVDPERMVTQIGHKAGKVGQPIPGVAVKTVDPETFALKEVNEPGLLLVKGANVMKGYLNNPVKTAEVIRDGWYITGDIASIDEDGFIHITDRLSRFSKIGGEMVPHIKIEENIMEIIGSTETVCAVTSVGDEKKGERLVVLHSIELDVDGVCEQLSKKGLPNLWIPRKDSFFKVESIPLLGSGKVDLKKVKETAAGLAAAAGQAHE